MPLYQSYFAKLSDATGTCALSIGLVIFVLFILGPLFYFGEGDFLLK